MVWLASVTSTGNLGEMLREVVTPIEDDVPETPAATPVAVG
jgi:hypothetical protein